MGKFSETVLQSILEKTNFISVYQEKVRLTKKGSKWWGLCPFHSEKTPSFSVDAERGLFYCFGCQKGGSVIDFIMETEKETFAEAVEELAERAHVPIPKPESSPASDLEDKERTELLNLYEKLANTFHYLLVQHRSGGKALEILRKRGVSDTLIQEFRLGYSPADISWLYRFLEKKGYSPGFLQKSGLFSARNRQYPLFSDRIMFPITDQRGRVIAFGGRLIEGDGPKYINSPDTMIFHKQENLFALDRALPAIKKDNVAMICEGYMDALSFHAAGIRYAVAPLGTAFTVKQAQILRRRADRILLCFDSDEAGQKASERACAITESAGLETSVLLMSGGKDASEILEKSGIEALKKIPEYCISSGDFLIRRAEELFDFGTMDGKSKASSFFYPYLDALESEVRRNGFLEIVGRRMGINPAALLADYQKAKAFSVRQGGRGDVAITVAARGQGNAARTADLFFMTAVILRPDLFPYIRELVEKKDFDDARARDLYAILEDGFANEVKDTSSLLSNIADESVRKFILSVSASGELDEELKELVEDGIKTIKIRSLERERIRLILEIERASSDRSAKENDAGISASSMHGHLMDLLKRKMHLDKEISRIKGDVDE